MRSPRVRLLAALAVGGAAAGAVVGVRRRRVSKRIREYTARVRASSGPVESAPYTPDDAAGLPAPIRRHCETVLQPGQRHVEAVRLRQQGTFRLGGAGAAWRPFTATQTYTVSPPGYVWDADIDFLPLVSVRVLDAYVDGEGLLRANALGAVPLAAAGPDARTNEAELQRYLSETPWFPTAMLPASGVDWTGIDDRTARATVSDRDVTASATFHVDEQGYVRRITADRYRQDVDAVASWVGRYRAYEERDGMLIPTEATVAWDGPRGEVPYWRGAITDVEYQTSTDRPQS